MKPVKTCIVAVIAMFGAMSATSASAACIAGPYSSGLPPVTINLSSSLLGYVNMQDQVLPVNSAIISPNGVYQLKLEKEGDLVLFKNGTQRIWSSGVQNCLPTPYSLRHAKLQSDGNFVVYYSLQNDPIPLIAVWSTGTFGNSNSRLYVKDDGRVLIENGNGQVIWSR